MRWSGSLRVSYAVVPITPNNGDVADETVVEWPCLLAVCVPRAEIRRCTSGSMVKEGYYFGVPPLALGGVSFSLHWYVAAAVLVLFAAFVFSFFRDPDRIIPMEPGAVVSPGDGRVVVVTDEENAGRPGKRVSIFLAVWNVHVNRSPAAGTITKMEYRPGKFLAAMRERASVENEQNVFTLSTESGEMVFKQIAGLIARRVVSWKKQGEKVARGERIGLVRFGSRVDVWVPKEAEILVKLGENVKGGSSVLARWPVKAAAAKLNGMDTAEREANLTATGKGS
jgi:phosphatidylserine decarboxylase